MLCLIISWPQHLVGKARYADQIQMATIFCVPAGMLTLYDVVGFLWIKLCIKRYLLKYNNIECFQSIKYIIVCNNSAKLPNDIKVNSKLLSARGRDIEVIYFFEILLRAAPKPASEATVVDWTARFVHYSARRRE
jgi:hypothetical protein